MGRVLLQYMQYHTSEGCIIPIIGYLVSSCGHQVGQVGFLGVLRFPPTRRAHERKHCYKRA